MIEIRHNHYSCQFNKINKYVLSNKVVHIMIGIAIREFLSLSMFCLAIQINKLMPTKFSIHIKITNISI